MVINSSIIRTV